MWYLYAKINDIQEYNTESASLQRHHIQNVVKCFRSRAPSNRIPDVQSHITNMKPSDDPSTKREWNGHLIMGKLRR
jgi:hypothetical protein